MSLHLVRSDLLHRGVDVQLELSGILPRVDGDRILLQQVLLNLVLNGCDAMEGLPPPRQLRLRSRESIDGGVCVEVFDGGRGIAPAILPSMFEPFETTKPEGMGMGLAVCRNIMESHGGRDVAATCRKAVHASASNCRRVRHDHDVRPLVHLVDNDEHVLKAYARLLAMRGHRYRDQYVDAGIPVALRPLDPGLRGPRPRHARGKRARAAGTDRCATTSTCRGVRVRRAATCPRACRR